MHRKIILCLALVIFLSSFRVALAEVVINEFVSDPDSGSEWIELWNDSSAEVNLSGWNWTDLASPGGETEHESSPRSLNGAISAGGFFVLEMNSVLNNTGDSIGLYNGTSLIDRVTFGKVNGYSKDLDLPAKGKSGALISGAWQTNQEPTKGTANPSAGSSGSDDDIDDDTDDEDSSSAASSSASTAATAKIKTEVSVRDIAYVGIPHAFQGRVVQGQGQPYHGRYFWNFGDGDFREVKVINTDKFTHTYFYPGEYAVLFEYYPDAFAETPEAASKITIKVVPASVSISRVGTANDFFIELSNDTNYNIDLSGWTLWSNGKTFTVPRNTILVAKKKIILSPRITGFSVADANSLKLTDAGNNLVSSYYPYSAPVVSKAVAPARNPALPSVSDSAAVGNAGEQIQTGNLEAAVLASDVADEFSPLLPAVALIFIGGSAYAVYFIRQKKTSSPGSDFEILDE